MEAEDWRFFFKDKNGRDLISTLSWDNPERASLFFGLYKENPADYNFIAEDNQIVTGEEIDWSAEVFVRMINLKSLALPSSDDPSAPK